MAMAATTGHCKTLLRLIYHERVFRLGSAPHHIVLSPLPA